MRLFVNYDTKELVQGLGLAQRVNSITFKRGDSSRVEVVFCRGAQVLELPAGSAGKFGLKARGRYESGYIVSALSWEKESNDSLVAYVFAPNFLTNELNTILKINGNPEDDLASIALMGEIRWTEPNAETPENPYVSSTRVFEAIVANNVNQGNEGVPVDANPPVAQQLDALEGGLDALREEVDGKADRDELPDYSVTNVAYVSINGNDATGQFGREDKPFATLKAAAEAGFARTSNTWCDLQGNEPVAYAGLINNQYVLLGYSGNIVGSTNPGHMRQAGFFWSPARVDRVGNYLACYWYDITTDTRIVDFSNPDAPVGIDLPSVAYSFIHNDRLYCLTPDGGFEFRELSNPAVVAGTVPNPAPAGIQWMNQAGGYAYAYNWETYELVVLRLSDFAVSSYPCNYSSGWYWVYCRPWGDRVFFMDYDNVAICAFTPDGPVQYNYDASQLSSLLLDGVLGDLWAVKHGGTRVKLQVNGADITETATSFAPTADNCVLFSVINGVWFRYGPYGVSADGVKFQHQETFTIQMGEGTFVLDENECPLFPRIQLRGLGPAFTKVNQVSQNYSLSPVRYANQTYLWVALLALDGVTIHNGCFQGNTSLNLVDSVLFNEVQANDMIRCRPDINFAGNPVSFKAYRIYSCDFPDGIIVTGGAYHSRLVSLNGPVGAKAAWEGNYGNTGTTASVTTFRCKASTVTDTALTIGPNADYLFVGCTFTNLNKINKSQNPDGVKIRFVNCAMPQAIFNTLSSDANCSLSGCYGY
ncbi:MAG: hypothetical protein LBH01_02010 [Verrucomicrobiales bacterium]|jgi:hypothetical protein|nr:hypothetical protein [Verrucomicrobiales bacterium]